MVKEISISQQIPESSPPRSESEESSGKLIVVTGFTSAGKTTVVEEFIRQHPEYKRVVTITTRNPRAHETDGVDYYFKSIEEFDRLRSEGELLEETLVVADDGTRKYHGTAKAEIARVLQGEKLIWVVDLMRGTHLNEVFSHFSAEDQAVLQQSTIPIIITMSRLTGIKDHYLRRETGQSSVKKRTALRERLRMERAICQDPTAEPVTVINNDTDIRDAVTHLETVILQSLSQAH